jgi:hypothetical protein
VRVRLAAPMSPLEHLLRTLAAKPADVRADFVGHLAFNVVVDLDPSALPPEMTRDLDRFIDRVGFEEDDTTAKTQERLAKHFAANAVDAELLRLFSALETAIADGDAARAAEQGRAASAVLGGGSSLVPVGAGGRVAGTMAGGLGGLLAARTGKLPPAKADAPKPPVTR